LIKYLTYSSLPQRRIFEWRKLRFILAILVSCAAIIVLSVGSMSYGVVFEYRSRVNSDKQQRILCFLIANGSIAYIYTCEEPLVLPVAPESGSWIRLLRKSEWEGSLILLLSLLENKICGCTYGAVKVPDYPGAMMSIRGVSFPCWFLIIPVFGISLWHYRRLIFKTRT
jgi:hypothetical protein